MAQDQSHNLFGDPQLKFLRTQLAKELQFVFYLFFMGGGGRGTTNQRKMENTELHSGALLGYHELKVWNIFESLFVFILA